MANGKRRQLVAHSYGDSRNYAAATLSAEALPATGDGFTRIDLQVAALGDAPRSRARGSALTATRGLR